MTKQYNNLYLVIYLIEKQVVIIIFAEVNYDISFFHLYLYTDKNMKSHPFDFALYMLCLMQIMIYFSNFYMKIRPDKDDTFILFYIRICVNYVYNV